MKLKKGDAVKVIAGKDAGKEGRILQVLRVTNRVVVEGVGVVKKHLKAGRAQATPDGGIVELNASIHASNVMLLDPIAGRPTRIGTSGVGENRVRVGRGKSKGNVVG